VRVFGHAEGTVLRWLTRAGMHAERMHERFFHCLALWHIQLDELKTRLREKEREVWVWVALDVKTKVIPSLAIGPRTQALCNALIHGLCGVLAPGCVPVFTSDGTRASLVQFVDHMKFVPAFHLVDVYGFVNPIQGRLGLTPTAWECVEVR
jgi:hypothetical protein